MDIKKFVQFEHAGWQSKGEAYSEYFQALTPKTFEAILAELEQPQDKHFLDLACGPGYISRLLSAFSSNVTGVDFSAKMVEIAQKLNPSIKFLEGDAENLQLPDQTFDYVIINFGVLHFGDPIKCFQECHRVLKPDGKLLFTLWLPATQSIGMQILYSSIASYADTSVIPEGPDFFKYANPQTATKDLSDIGFKNISFKDVDTCWEISNPADFYNAYVKGGARLGAMIDRQSPEVKTKLEAAVLSKLEPLKVADIYKIPVPSRLWSAQK